jgi:hypothetical protein
LLFSSSAADVHPIFKLRLAGQKIENEFGLKKARLMTSVDPLLQYRNLPKFGR